MKKLLIAAAAALGVALIAGESRADGCAGNPFCNNGHAGWFGGFFSKQPVPAFQAAPWYLYWPYNAHFMTPAPLTGAYYAPPHAGGQMINPYFPAQLPPPPPPAAAAPAPTTPAPLPGTVIPGTPNPIR